MKTILGGGYIKITKEVIIIGSILLTFISCSRTNETHFDSDDDRYIAYNNKDSLEFDKNWKLIYSTVSFNDSISLVKYENDSLKNIHNYHKNKKYITWFDSLSNPIYIENEPGLDLTSSLGHSIQYGEDSDLERLIIDFTFILDGHIKAYNTDQYLVYKNNEIDTSSSSFYMIEESDSGGIFKLYNRFDSSEDFFYQLIYYTDPFLELSPISIAGNLYIKDTAKQKEILNFRKGQDPFIIFDNDVNKPTVFQLYALKMKTGEPLHYRLGVVRPDFSSENKITQLKNDLSEKFHQFKNKSYLKDVEKSLDGFPFVSIKSQGVVEVDKEKLKKLYSKYKGKE